MYDKTSSLSRNPHFQDIKNKQFRHILYDSLINVESHFPMRRKQK